MTSKKIAYLFPGQGSQTVGMGRSLAEHFPVAAATFAEADEALGFPLSRIFLDGPEDELRLTENTQPAILTVSVAAWRVLAEHGIAPAMAAGHSLGEWSAHVAAGTLSFTDAVRAVKARGRSMQTAVPAGEGAMAAVLALEADQVAAACAEAAAETPPRDGQGIHTTCTLVRLGDQMTRSPSEGRGHGSPGASRLWSRTKGHPTLRYWIWPRGEACCDGSRAAESSEFS